MTAAERLAETEMNENDPARSRFQPRDPDYKRRVENSFARQRVMQMLDVRIAGLAPGRIELEMPFNADYTQQHGFLHAGIVATVLDSACGYAAFSLMDPAAAVLTVEFKANLLAPAQGERFYFAGEVIKPGRTITVSEARAYALREDGRRLVASMTATLMAVMDREGVSQ